MIGVLCFEKAMDTSPLTVLIKVGGGPLSMTPLFSIARRSSTFFWLSVESRIMKKRHKIDEAQQSHRHVVKPTHNKLCLWMLCSPNVAKSPFDPDAVDVLAHALCGLRFTHLHAA